MGQRHMPLMAEAYQPGLKRVPQSEIERCDSIQDALLICRQHSQYRKDYMIAELMDMSPTQFSRSLKGTMNFPPEKIEELEDVCQCMAVTQYLCYRRGIEIPEAEHDRHIRELEEQAAEVQRQLDEAKKRVAA